MTAHAPPPRRMRADARRNRERLLTEARAAFAEHGADFSLEEIARRAGVTTGAIYSRYRGKAELLAEAIEWATDDEFDRLFTDHRFAGRMEDILRIAGRHLIVHDDCGDGPGAGGGLLLESFAAARHEPEVARLLRTHLLERYRRLATVVESAKAEGGIDPDLDTTALVTFCYAVGLGFLLVEVVDLELPEREAWEALIERLVDATGRLGPTGETAAPGSGPAAPGA